MNEISNCSRRSSKSFRRAISGDKYKVAAVGMSCASRPWAIKFTHARVEVTGQTLKGPRGFTCIAYAELVPYTGVCTHPPHNHPFLGWGPRTK
jgi:hypothetical protein